MKAHYQGTGRTVKDNEFYCYIKRSMAYNRKNILQRMVKVQNITLEHTQRGITQEWVYNNIIYPRYDISRATYYAYLSTPAKMQLTKLREKEKEQLKLEM